MITAFDRVTNQPRPTPAKPSSLAHWTLVRARGNSDLAQLQSWIANDASADELALLSHRAPGLLFATVDHALQHRWLLNEQGKIATAALAQERACAAAISPLFDATHVSIWHTTAQPLRRVDCALGAAGAIAGFWACQVHLAASVERAIERLELPRELLLLKRKHSARCARNLIDWERASHTDLRSFPGTHRVASGITAMVDRYCTLLTTS